jgi:hypothetical protein
MQNVPLKLDQLCPLEHRANNQEKNKSQQYTSVKAILMMDRVSKLMISDHIGHEAKDVYMRGDCGHIVDGFLM